MGSMPLSEIDCDLNPRRALEALAWRDVQAACFALSGSHGPHRKIVRQELTEALERLQRVAEIRQQRSSSYTTNPRVNQVERHAE